MFSKSSKRQKTASPTLATGARNGPFSLIGGDVTVTGNIVASADLHIDGHVEGDIRCAALVQGPESRITGHIAAKAARLAGLVDGSITADELVIDSTARVTGDVHYERITIEAGGRIEGRFAHKSDAEDQGGALKLIASESAA